MIATTRGGAMQSKMSSNIGGRWGNARSRKRNKRHLNKNGNERRACNQASPSNRRRATSSSKASIRTMAKQCRRSIALSMKSPAERATAQRISKRDAKVAGRSGVRWYRALRARRLEYRGGRSACGSIAISLRTSEGRRRSSARGKNALVIISLSRRGGAPHRRVA